MKLDFDTILLIVSLFLAIAIFLSVAFGCAFKNNIKENFKNKKNDNKGNKLSKFENKLLEGISSGSYNNKDIEKFIKKGDFTKENLKNMISHVEKLKNKK